MVTATQQAIGQGTRDVLDEVACAGERPGQLFVDLAALLKGDLAPELPAIGPVSDGRRLLYRGRLNEVHGEPGLGKTNVALALTIPELEAGRKVVFLDPEDTAAAIVRRLLAFGAKPATIVSGFHYLQNPEVTDLLRVVDWARDHRPDVVIVDGLAELLAAQGLSENDPADLLPFFRAYLRPLAEAGAAVLVTDHVTKDSDSRGRWARGSGAKLGRYDGAVYELRSAEAYTPHKAGKIRLVVSKDRNGQVGPVGTVAAEILFTPNGDGTTAVVVQPKDDKPFLPTALMEKVSRAVERDPRVSKRDLRKLGKAEYVDKAIEALEQGGFLTVESGRPGHPSRFISRKDYRANEN